MTMGEELGLLPRNEVGQGSVSRVLLCQAVFEALFEKWPADHFREPGAVAEQGCPRPPPEPVGREVVARQHAVAIKKQEIAAPGEPGSVVSNSGESEAGVRLGGEPHGKGGSGRECRHYFGGAVIRAVITDDDFEVVVPSPLAGDRLENQLEVPGSPERRHQNRAIDRNRVHTGCPPRWVAVARSWQSAAGSPSGSTTISTAASGSRWSRGVPSRTRSLRVVIAC